MSIQDRTLKNKQSLFLITTDPKEIENMDYLIESRKLLNSKILNLIPILKTEMTESSHFFLANIFLQ